MNPANPQSNTFSEQLFPTIQHFLCTTLSHNPTLSLHNSFPQSNTFSEQLFRTFRHHPFPSPSFPGPWFRRAAREQRQWPPDTLHHTEKWPGRLTLSTAPVTTKHGTLSCTHSLTHCVGSAPVTSKHGTHSLAHCIGPAPVTSKHGTQHLSHQNMAHSTCHIKTWHTAPATSKHGTQHLSHQNMAH